MCWYFRFPFWGTPWSWGFPFMMFVGLIFWIFVIGIFFYLVRQSQKYRHQHKKDELEDILRRRLIEGKITQEEYEKLRKLFS